MDNKLINLLNALECLLEERSIIEHSIYAFSEYDELKNIIIEIFHVVYQMTDMREIEKKIMDAMQIDILTLESSIKLIEKKSTLNISPFELKSIRNKANTVKQEINRELKNSKELSEEKALKQLKYGLFPSATSSELMLAVKKAYQDYLLLPNRIITCPVVETLYKTLTESSMPSAKAIKELHLFLKSPITKDTSLKQKTFKMVLQRELALIKESYWLVMPNSEHTFCMR